MSMRLGLIMVGLADIGDGYFIDYTVAKYGARGVVREAYWVSRVAPRHKDYTLPEWAQIGVAKLMLLPVDKTGFARLEDIGTVQYSSTAQTCKVTVIVPEEHSELWSELL